MSPSSPSLPLRLAKLAALVPMVLGSVAYFGWLVTTGGRSDAGEAFVYLGIAALCAGAVLAPLGLLALWFAWRLGAARRALGVRLALLVANVPLALAYLAGLGVANIQRLEVRNASTLPLEELTLNACRTQLREVGTLAPGESYVWRFRPPSEGSVGFSARQGDQRLQSSELAVVFIFNRVDILLLIEDAGEWSVDERDGAPWSWVPGT